MSYGRYSDYYDVSDPDMGPNKRIPKKFDRKNDWDKPDAYVECELVELEMHLGRPGL